MKSLIIGASAGLGRALSEVLASKGHELFLVASDARDINPMVSDLSYRYKTRVYGCDLDLRDFSPNILYEKVHSSIGEIDNLFLVAGISFLERDFAQLSVEEIEQINNVNFLSCIKIVSIFLKDLTNSANKNCVGIGSVAASRARNRNTTYAACKKGLEFFFSGLKHLTANTNLKIQFYRVGFLDTQLNFEQKSLIPKASPTFIAEKLYKGLGKDIEMRYLPWWWAGIMFIYKMIPWFLYKRIGVVDLRS
ncbi:MAG: hypothetical protein A2W71_01665 [Candidatus Nealsonbacteria bacterium RIFCSPLOWO2_02_39_8]|uniref:Short-chain dehydrogenase n=1 Tax=Candidatus Nealsonbacteria bacterium RIFCSPLOWO2_02_39_8 TaxID=1801674 RepID=A0A1G2ELR6_9BACT|nr:MAG: hypothetical protein A2W71_01665 [Candidatus Nealsonbacteria bacterium RIFCSPLOWO2_02_39_8]